MIQLLIVFLLFTPQIQASEVKVDFIPGISYTKFDDGTEQSGFVIYTRGRYFPGSSGQGFSFLLELDFKMIVPDIIAGVGWQFGSQPFVSFDVGGFYSNLFGIGLAGAPAIGYEFDKDFYVILPFVTKFTFGGILLFDYFPRIGLRF